VPPDALLQLPLFRFLSGRVRLFRQPDDEALAAPELNIPVLDQTPRLLDRFRIIGTGQPTNLTKCPSLPTKYAR
jgi:hypothetical protein